MQISENKNIEKSLVKRIGYCIFYYEGACEFYITQKDKIDIAEYNYISYRFRENSIRKIVCPWENFIDYEIEQSKRKI